MIASASGGQSSCYITPEGKAVLIDELRFLSQKKRPGVTQALAAAAAEGDRSENAEYIYRKKQLREIDRRIRYLVKRLEVLKVVDSLPTDQQRVFFGAWVELEDQDGEIRRYRLVGSDEFDLRSGLLSIDSPMARAMLNKAVDDDVIVETPKGQRCYVIKDVRYVERR